MLKKRLLTAIILISLVLFIIFYTNWLIISLSLSIVVLLAGIEWLQLIPLSSKYSQWLFLFILIVCCYGSLYFNSWLLYGLLIWTFVFFAVIDFPRSQQLWGYPRMIIFLGLLVLTSFFYSFVKLNQLPHGNDYCLYILVLVWVADTGAYFSGKQWGHHKLIPQVSPGKTVAGLIGGYLSALLVMIIGYCLFLPPQAGYWFFLSSAIIFISILGDLFISMLKRRVNLKDSGNLLPGHGGILDRIDSLIPAVSVFYLGLILNLSGVTCYLPCAIF